MMRLIALSAIISAVACQAARSEAETVPQPYELTARGVISAAATEAYKQAIESCYGGKPGDAPQGPQFLACLKQQYRSESAALAAAYNGSVAALKSSSDRTARLRSSQNAWVKFRDDNCAFARSVAPREQAEESFYDCLLRTTIDRKAELRSLVGD
jgi:uncharacterized protein YecT (DUF1311 family)